METTQHQTSSSSNSFSEAFSRRKSTSLFDLQVHLHRQFHLTFIASYRTVLFFILLYALNYILVATVFSATSKEAGCLSSDTSSAVCSLSFDEEIEFKENAFNLCYTVLYVGLVMIYSSTAVFAGNVRCFRNEHRNNWYSLNVFYLSSVTVSLLELTLFSVIISTLAFFVTSQHAADDYQLNLVRFGYFTLFIWTLCLYVQGIGQLIGVLLINWHDLAAIVSIVLYLCISMLNGFFVNTDISGNPLIITGTNAVALKFISRGLVYSIYGIDRCAAEDEESVILPFLNIDVDTVWTDCWWIVVNLIVCRMATFALMQWRFAAATQRVKKKAVVNGGKLELELGGIDNPVKVELEELHSNGKSPHQADLPLASKPLILAWKNVTLYASSNSVNPFRRHAPRKMLQSLNGHFRFGTLGALMGTSGAGKTTLLKVLNGQCKSRLSPESSFHLAKATPLQTCFLTQEVSGHLMPGLTVRQSVLYASKLKNRNYYDNQSAQLVVVDHEKLVENLLVELGIKDVEDTKVERCSGGERKRIALALELASRQMPNLICIDEPTSGLDSNSAEIVISCLRNLTRQHPITIIASLHQPNTEILHMIDQLYVLALGGSCIYSGPPQNIKARLGALTSQSATEHCDKFPIEELIELSCLGADNITVQELVRYHNEEEVSMENELLAQTEPKGLLRKRTSLSLHSAAVLSQRYFHYFLGHHWRYLAFYFSNYIGYALFLKLFFNFNMVYLDGCLNARDGLVLLQNRCTASEATIADMFLLMDNLRYTHFFSVFYLTFIYLQAAFDYRQDLVYFVNEHRNGWYSTLTFYAVKSLTEIVPLLLLNLVYVYVCNYYEFIRVGLFWEIYLVLTLASIGFQGLAHILALLTRGNFARLTILSITLTLFAVLLDDYLILHHRLHFVYQVLSNLSIPRFAYEALIMLQYGFGRCKAGQTQAMFYVMQLSDEDIYYCIGMLVGNLILYRVVAVYLLIRRVDGSGLRWLRCATTKKRDSCASSGSK